MSSRIDRALPDIYTVFICSVHEHSHFALSENNHGLIVYRTDCRAGGADLGRRDPVRSAAGAAMSTLYWIALILTLGLFGYLLYAMLKAEDF
jgi:K+-transporting ATPase KdpF subunit